MLMNIDIIRNMTERYVLWELTEISGIFQLLKTKYKSLKRKHVLVSICFDNQ